MKFLFYLRQKVAKLCLLSGQFTMLIFFRSFLYLMTVLASLLLILWSSTIWAGANFSDVLLALIVILLVTWTFYDAGMRHAELDEWLGRPLSCDSIK